jgi:ABC-type multidrug transport system fused ATPase/permease subunit
MGLFRRNAYLAQGRVVTAPVRLRLARDLVASRRAKWLLAVALATALASTAGTLAVPWLVKDLVAHVAVTRSLDATAWQTAGEIAGAAVIAAVCQFTASYLMARQGELVVLRLRRRAMSHTLALPVSTVQAAGVGSLTARIISDAILIRSMMDTSLMQLPLAAVTSASTLVIMGVLNWQLMLVTLAVFAVVFGGLGLLLSRLKQSVGIQQTALAGLAQRFAAFLPALGIVKAYRAQRWAADRLGDDAADLMRGTLRTAKLESAMVPGLNLGQQVALVVVSLTGIWMVADGHLSAGAFAGFLLYLLQLAAPLALSLSSAARLQAGLAAKLRFEQFLSLPTEPDYGLDDQLSDGPGPNPATTAPNVPAVEFLEVSYAYPDGHPGVESVSLTVPATGVTVLCGQSGAGKSTCLALIERFGEPATGTVTVFGAPLQAWPLDSLRSRIAYLDQQCTVLQASVRDNLCWGDRTPDDRLWHALDQVGLREVVAGLPGGLDTVIGAGTDLSGGQRQRLALARVLLQEAPLVLLDEPTSQMDGPNEAQFHQLIRGIAAKRAVLVVAHRASTIRAADRIVVFEAGRVIDSGDHDELMDRCNAYRALHKAQAVAPADKVLSP